jgi:hypothetical protein
MLYAKTTVRNVRLSISIAALCALTLIAGCEAGPEAKRSAAQGAVVGAGLGLLVGALSGDSDVAVAATVMGAAAGATEWGYDGFRQDQENRRTAELADAIRASGQNQNAPAQPAADPDARAREELTRFLGVWRVSGWVQDEGQRRNVSAQVNGSVQMGYFVEMAWLDLRIEGIDSQVWGTTTLGYDGREGFSMSSRFNTTPDSIDANFGRWDAAQRAFLFEDRDFRTSVTFTSPDSFSVTTTSGSNTIESYTFTRG